MALALLVVVGLLVAPMAAAVPLAQPKRDRGRDQPRIERQRPEGAKESRAKPERRAPKPQIFGGSPVVDGAYPFMAFVEVDGQFTCGGTLIDPWYVLTAGHCVEDDWGNLLDPWMFRLVIGKADRTEGGPENVRGVYRVARPDAYDPEMLSNDVAVLQLDWPVPESVARPIRLVGPNDRSYETPKRPAIAAGWGLTESGDTPTRLLATTLNVVSDAACVGAYGDELVPGSMLCAAAKGRDTCDGDSGGPLLGLDAIGTKKIRKKKGKKKRVPIYELGAQIGVTSWGYGCAERGYPGVYTQLSEPTINGWVRDVVSGRI